MTNSTVGPNNAVGAGGGLWNGGVLTQMGGSVSGNTAGNGGGLHSTGTATLIGTTVSGNTATDEGGGIANLGALQVTNSTISGNNAATDGGGIANTTTGMLTVLNSTISDNIAGGVGGGIFHDGTTATLQNTIVAGNTAVDCDGAVVSFDNNLDRDNTCNLVAPGDLPGVDPLLGPLANNGGSTQTHALPAGSPAIDAGDDGAAPAADQRGFPRARASDIGAFEFRGTDVDGDGFEAESVGGTDCDDTDPAIFPGATDVRATASTRTVTAQTPARPPAASKPCGRPGTPPSSPVPMGPAPPRWPPPSGRGWTASGTTTPRCRPGSCTALAAWRSSIPTRPCATPMPCSSASSRATRWR